MTIEQLKQNKIAIHCPTEGEAKEVLKVLEEAGTRWIGDGEYKSLFDFPLYYLYGECECYHIDCGGLSHFKFGYKEGNYGYTIIPAAQFLASNKQYDFTNKAIKCDTWEQMEYLAELAKAQGLELGFFNKSLLEEMPHFCLSANGRYYGHYSVYEIFESPVSYSDFINPPQAQPPRVENWWESVQQFES